jgi:hypothetical protein
MSQTVRNQSGRQSEGVPVGHEPGVDLRWFHATAAFGDPQRRMILTTEPGPHVLHVIDDRLDRPAHHRGDITPPGRLALLGLPYRTLSIPYRPNCGAAGFRPKSTKWSLDVSVRRSVHW